MQRCVRAKADESGRNLRRTENSKTISATMKAKGRSHEFDRVFERLRSHVAADGAWLSAEQRVAAFSAVAEAYNCEICGATFDVEVCDVQGKMLNGIIKRHHFEDSFDGLAHELAHVMLWHQSRLTKEHWHDAFRRQLANYLNIVVDQTDELDAAYCEMLLVSFFPKQNSFQISYTEQLQMVCFAVCQRVYYFAARGISPPPLPEISPSTCASILKRRAPSTVGALNVHPERNWLASVARVDNQAVRDVVDDKLLAWFSRDITMIPYRATTLVLHDMQMYAQIMEVGYVPRAVLTSIFAREVPGRTLTRDQLELVAAETSLAVSCDY